MIKSAEFTALLVLWAVATPAVALIVRGFVRRKANRCIRSLNKRVRALRDENNELGATHKADRIVIDHNVERCLALEAQVESLEKQNNALNAEMKDLIEQHRQDDESLENRINALNTDIQTLSQQNAALQGQAAAFAARPVVRIHRKPSKRGRVRLHFVEGKGKVVALSTGSYHQETADETAQRLAASRFEVAE